MVGIGGTVSGNNQDVANTNRLYVSSMHACDFLTKYCLRLLMYTFWAAAVEVF